MLKEILCILIALLVGSSSIFLVRRKYDCSSLFVKRFRKIFLYAAAAGICILFGWLLPQRIRFWLSESKVLLVLFCLMGSALTDLDSRTIPNLFPKIELLGAGVIFVLHLFFQRETVLSYLMGGLLAAVLTFVFLLAVRKIAKGGLGMGDIKLLSAMALLIGFYGTLHTLILSELLALSVSLVLLISKKITMKGTIPFAPFFLLGFVLSMVLGLL